MVTKDDIVSLADLYLSRSRMKTVTLSYRVFKDSKKLDALKRDSDLTLTRYTEALEWFSNNWPDDLEWPHGVERPAKSEVDA